MYLKSLGGWNLVHNKIILVAQVMMSLVCLWKTGTLEMKQDSVLLYKMQKMHSGCAED